jgi:hypothetical protein
MSATPDHPRRLLTALTLAFGVAALAFAGAPAGLLAAPCGDVGDRWLAPPHATIRMPTSPCPGHARSRVASREGSPNSASTRASPSTARSKQPLPSIAGAPSHFSAR